MAAFHIQFISEILEAFGQLPIILCGDFNSRHPLWFDSTTNKNGYILKSIIEEQNLFVHNLKIPTCRNASIIDLTISNKHSIGLIHNWRTSALSVTSDHLAILFDIFNMINLANNNRQTSTWKFREKSANWTKFAESISPSDLLDLNSASKHIVNCEDIDNVVNKLTNLVIEAAYSSLDVKHHTSINTTTSKNWWNKELQQLKEHLHYLRNLYYRGGNLNPSIYRAARNKYLRAINRAKKTSWKIFIEENESTNAFGNAYRIFKRLRSADIQVGIPLLNKTAECMREQKMKEMLTAFFPDDDVRLDNEEHTLIRNHIPSFTNREIIFITEKEIKDLCSNLNIRKAPGPDNVSNYMIKHLLLSILPSLVKLFNECLVLGYYPESWKHSVLKIITKPQKADYEAINSYRPISLTSNFSKIFETIIKNKILNYYNHNNLLSHRQHGFTKRKSTITALDKITETILKHKQNELVALIAIDISGAFDNAWWPALIKRMDEDHVPAVLIKIIQSFLNRRRKTSLTFSNTTISKYLSKGCPQGGPLSPLLWNIVLNDLLINFASPNSEIICYADDVSIVCWHKTIEGLKNETERTLNYVIQWCTRNKLKLSPEKTGLIHMHGKQNIPMGTPNFIIKPVEEVKILGIKFSNHRIKSKINFTPHINDILCKINRMKNLLFSLCGKMWGLDAKKRLILYKTLFRPILTYGSEIWYKFINKRSKQRLNSQQYQILLWVVRAYKTTSSNCIHSLSKIPILTDQIESLIIKYDLANLSKEEINVFRPHAPTIIHNYIESRMAETIANTNETFRKFFPFGIPFYFRPNFYNSQFVTGHGNFGEFLSKIGATDDPSCFCGKENQDSMHLLMECPIFHSYRSPKMSKQTMLETSLDKDKEIKDLINALSKRLDSWGERLESLLSAIDDRVENINQTLQQLEESSAITKSRERNLIFYRIEQDNNEDCREWIRKVIEENMQKMEKINITQCHRLSRKPGAPILIEVPEQNDRSTLFTAAFNFRGTKISLSKDYRMRMREQRCILNVKRRELVEKGDINIHTGTYGYLHNPLERPLLLSPDRKSRDPVLSKHWEQLINFLDNNLLTIINSRTISDKTGNCTFISSRGSSAVDYFIISYSLLEHVVDLKNLDNNQVSTDQNLDSLVNTFSKQILNVMLAADMRIKVRPGRPKSKPWYNKECYLAKNLLRQALQPLRKRTLTQTTIFMSQIGINFNKKKYLQEKQELLKNAYDRKRPIYSSPIDPELYCEISITEITREISSQANEKACGADEIPNEALKTLPFEHLFTLKNIFNRIINSGLYPLIWSKSIIHPIFKSGDRDNPSNYRGIALISNLSKLFTSILKLQLRNWIEGRSIIPENQAGFRKGYSCQDHIFTLLSLIQLNNKLERRKLYAFFVDLKKAFDTVPHSLLWSKLGELGLDFHFVNLIRNYFKQMTTTVRWNELFTEPIKIRSGVLQGEPLSPYLFILFIMVFRNGGRPAKSNKWFWGDQLLTATSKYLYLGYPLTTTFSFSQVASYFKGKALAASSEVWKIMEKSRLNSIGSSMKLLDSIILSTLLYSAPIWANEKNKILDQIQNKYLRRLLNLLGNKPGYIIRMESGHFSLGVTATKLILKFWLRILKMEKSRLPAICLAQL
ncbi:hypothetical protein LAZ67_X003190 [Cordylochernes scorpioides]|uniref:Reverse transcriptase domain-containing protein n=1 Tax=Cordylochernes scorpioides TaxID=51811 RepID=A0ABY6LTY7_9ARAC|nr:hypothetical protein LAZ67_X003190 [Cordylochernes scorpioides]